MKRNPLNFIPPTFRRLFVLITLSFIVFWIYKTEFSYTEFSFLKYQKEVEYKVPVKSKVIKPTTSSVGVDGNEKAIELAYKNAVKKGYTSSLDSYREQLKTNGKDLNLAFANARKNGYLGNINSYRLLVGVSIPKELAEQYYKLETKKRYVTDYLIKFDLLIPKNPGLWHNLIFIIAFFWAIKPIVKKNTYKNKDLVLSVILGIYILTCVSLTYYLDFQEYQTELRAWEKKEQTLDNKTH